MTSLHVCPLSRVDTVLASSSAGWVVSLLASVDRVPALPAIPVTRRLHLALSDITSATPDHILAEQSHVETYLRFLQRWDRREPLLIHCYAGVSRSTAAAFVALCALDPGTSEFEHAQRLRVASPTATPNRHLVALADGVLGRSGRMSAAVASIGRGVDCFEGVCFALPLPAQRVGPGAFPPSLPLSA